MKSFIFQNLASFRKILIKSAVCGLALVANGQALATNYYSLGNITGVDLTDGTKWSTGGCLGAAVGGTINMGAGDMLGICKSTSLTLTGSDVVTASTFAFDPGSPYGVWGGGVVKFSSGNKSIMNGNPSLSSIALNVSAMTSGNTIGIVMNSVTFSSVTGGSLSCGGSTYTAGTAISAGTTCTVTVTPTPISAPIDLNFSKQPTTFASEVKLK